MTHDATPISSAIIDGDEEVRDAKLAEGWYYVSGTINIGQLDLEGDVNIILCDEAILNVGSTDGFYFNGYDNYETQGYHVTIYGQVFQTGLLHSLNTMAVSTLTINGGRVQSDGDIDLYGQGEQSEEFNEGAPSLIIRRGVLTVGSEKGWEGGKPAGIEYYAHESAGLYILGCSAKDDYICAGGYSTSGYITIVSDQILVDDDDNEYSINASDIAGKTLRLKPDNDNVAFATVSGFPENNTYTDLDDLKKELIGYRTDYYTVKDLSGEEIPCTFSISPDPTLFEGDAGQFILTIEPDDGYYGYTGSQSIGFKLASLVTYYIAYNLRGGILPEDQSNPYTYTEETETFTLVNPVKTGYTFTGWIDNDVEGDEPHTTVEILRGSTGNRDFTAVWTVNQYTITFDTGSGSNVDPITQDYATAIVAPDDPTRTGNTFAGWNQALPETMPAQDMTLTARWTRVEYAIDYELDGGTNAAANPASYNVESPDITLSAPTRRGYTFTGWTGSNGNVQQTSVVIAHGTTDSKSYTAHWTPIPLAINLPATLSATVGGQAVTTATVGQTVTLAVQSGYHIEEAPTVTDEDAQVLTVTDRGDGTFTFTMPVSAVTVSIFAVETGWAFTGTYATVNFGPDDTDIYGFVGTGGTGTDLGTFVRVGGYVRVKPLRAYLRAPYKAGARAMTRAAGDNGLPQSMTVRLIGANGETTSLNEELRMKNEEFATAAGWYTIDGRRLMGKPSRRGVYMNGGRKVVFK